MNFTFGSDPEFVVFNGDTPVSAIGIVKGDIENRIAIKGHEFYYDNVLAECAIKPGKNKSEVIKNITECLKVYTNLIKPYKLVAQASCTFKKEDMKHPDARKVGCAPDMCAYEMSQMDPPKKEMKKSNFRSCGGHIHLGSDVLLTDGVEPYELVYMLDLLIAVPSLVIDKDPTSAARRNLYGQAGRFRVKPYGLEYRTLSNFWLKSPRLVSLVYDLCELALKIVQSEKVKEFWKFDIEKFYNSENLSDAWTCTYDSLALRNGINQGNLGMVDSHLKIARELIPKNLRDELDACENCSWQDLESEWGLSQRAASVS